MAPEDGGGDTMADRARALDAAVRDALASIHDRGDEPEPETVDERWLGIGLRLGLERPGHARHLLDLLGTGVTGGAAEAESAVATGGVTGGATGGGADAASGEPGNGAGITAAADAPAARVPVASMLLARSAALAGAELAGLGPDVVFGWAAELRPGQVLAIGRLVVDMVAGGAPAEIVKGLGLAWDGGTRIPHEDRRMLFDRFTDLQVEVAGILAGRDLRATTTAKATGFGVFAQLLGTRQTGQTEAGAAIDAAGEPGGRGLVAMWNTWMSMRYRSSVPAATFELLVRPWVTVVGPLPDD